MCAINNVVNCTVREREKKGPTFHCLMLLLASHASQSRYYRPFFFLLLLLLLLWLLLLLLLVLLVCCWDTDLQSAKSSGPGSIPSNGLSMR